jgi:tetratricopeptide (TPR) repeat protein
MKKLSVLFATVLLIACAGNKEQGDKVVPTPETLSFSGKPLFAMPATPQALAKADSVITAIKAKGNLTEDDYVEIGKQFAGTSRFSMALENYNEGLSKYPDSFKLLRNRGHRYINLRQLDNAIKDLTRAEELSRDQPDVMEYGLDGKATATVRHQIWYHIGVCHFLNRDYAQAATAFEKALATANEGSNGNIIGATDWLYNSYMKMGLKEKAEPLLAAINPDMDTDREQAYFRRIMLYKGIIKPEELINVNKSPDSLSVQEVTKLYGLANWYAFAGDKETARKLYKTILESNAWPGFAYAAAEKELEPRE